MSDAFYHEGLTIEYDSSDRHLTIDGQQVDLENPELPNLQPQSLKELGEWIIDNYPEYKTRKALREDHLAILKQGVDVWNKWRLDHPETRPIL